ncbi:DUF4142 domain-containing protein [Mucilaginibacter robiniae]|uniref:DUF4142 domain-containing protein n=1 Tax=Mucilaginibacter robiniae TaxID=2728022 RepID=A0A7L5E1Z7_9SPHI|nr:DUF4142 domain-containing protein [Mucilaginibacter robiniae]QJD96319.1 DUF4142 domain-containing protein [Mucilaginibacter robiniae]
MKKYALLMVLSAFIATFAHAQTTDTVTTNFVKNAALGGMKEVAAGKLAEQKGTSASVKAFGKQMITDHTMANEKLAKIAKSKGYMVPKTTPPASPLLTKTSGAMFDKNYVTMMIADHKQTIAIFEKASTQSKDADIKAFATQTLPKLKHHLSMVESIASSMKLKM